MSEKWRAAPMLFFLAVIEWLMVVGFVLLCALALIGIFVVVGLGLEAVLYQ